MPVYSMTGFATVACDYVSPEIGRFSATLTIRSLNGRFFEAQCRMPSPFARVEQGMIQRCKEQLRRGTITITVNVHTPGVLKGSVVPAIETARRYVAALHTLQTELGLSGTVSLADLLAFPDLFETVEPVEYDALSDYLLTRLDSAVADLLAVRMREGAALEKEMRTLMDLIVQAIDELAPLADRITAERRERFVAEIQTALDHTATDIQDAHINALSANIPAIDTREEIVRLRAHHAHLLHTLADAEIQKGKKLEFILQEMLREINTLGAKLLDAAAMQPILLIKTKLEQAREQVQNIV